mgnify:CR=1 FL=1
MKDMEFLKLAKSTVAAYASTLLELVHEPEIAEDDVYISSFHKSLKNWKALLITKNHPKDGMCYEVTFDGDQSKLYLDAYKKFQNIAFIAIQKNRAAA